MVSANPRGLIPKAHFTHVADPVLAIGQLWRYASQSPATVTESESMGHAMMTKEQNAGLAGCDTSQHYVAAPNLKVSPFDSRGESTRFLVTLDGHHYRVNRLCVDALQFFSKPNSIDEFASTFGRMHGGTIPNIEDRFTAAAIQFFKNGLIVLESDHSTSRISGPPKKLKYSTELFSANSLGPITTATAYLFQWPWWLLCGTVVVAIHVASLLVFEPDTNQSAIAWWVIVMIVYTSLIVHEIGHLAACKFFGAKHGGMGVGLFFIYPVFYADVSDCWVLDRYQRAVVDLGGVMFQLMFGASIAIIGHSFGFMQTNTALLSILFCALINLNPFFRLDGYWFLSDIVGVTSLEQMRNDLCSYCWNMLRSRRPLAPMLFAESKMLLVVIAIYMIGSIVFIIHLITLVIRGLPAAGLAILTNLQHLFSSSRSFDTTANAIATIFLAMFSSLMLMRIAYRLGKRFVHSTMIRRLNALKNRAKPQ